MLHTLITDAALCVCVCLYHEKGQAKVIDSHCVRQWAFVAEAR